MDELLFAALVSLVEWRLGEFNAQDLVNMAWVFVTVDRLDELLFAVLARAVEWRLG